MEIVSLLGLVCNLQSDFCKNLSYMEVPMLQNVLALSITSVDLRATINGWSGQEFEVMKPPKAFLFVICKAIHSICAWRDCSLHSVACSFDEKSYMLPPYR